MTITIDNNGSKRPRKGRGYPWRGPQVYPIIDGSKKVVEASCTPMHENRESDMTYIFDCRKPHEGAPQLLTGGPTSHTMHPINRQGTVAGHDVTRGAREDDRGGGLDARIKTHQKG